MAQEFDGGDSGRDTGSESAMATTQAVTTAPPADDTADAADGADTEALDPCAVGPAVAAQIRYAGSAERTVAHAMVRGPDGMLYMGGTRAGPSDMELWLAAVDPAGELRWETSTLPREGGNLAGWTPTAADLYLDGEVLRVAGFTYEDHPIGWHGSVWIDDGELFESTETELLAWYAGAPSPDPDGRYLVGRIHGPEGYLITRMEGGELAWGRVSAEAGPFDDVAADVVSVGELLLVGGRLQQQPWIVALTSNGEPLWDRRILGTPVYEADSGSLEVVGTQAGVVVGGGDLRLEKPMSDGSGSYTYNQVLLAAWTLDGEPLWTWQREPEVVRPGVIEALAIGPDGTIFVTGRENAIHASPYFFAAAIDSDGRLLWSIDDETRPEDPLLADLDGQAIVVGGPGQLWVLANAGGLGEETTTLLEICY